MIEPIEIEEEYRNGRTYATDIQSDLSSVADKLNEVIEVLNKLIDNEAELKSLLGDSNAE